MKIEHENGQALKELYRNKNATLENSERSKGDFVCELNMLSVLIQQCLRDSPESVRDSLKLVLRIPVCSVPAPPPAPATSSGGAASSAAPLAAAHPGFFAAAVAGHP